MRIGIDCRMYSSSFTGIGRYTHEFVENLIKLNGELKNPHEIFLFFNSPEFQQFKTFPHVTKILVNARHYSLKEQTTFLGKLNQAKLDLAYFPHFNVPILYRRPYILTIHDLILNLYPGHKMTKIYHRLGYHLTIKNATRKAKKIITISQNTKNDIIKYLKVTAPEIEVIYNGISEQFHELLDKNSTKPTLKKYHITQPFLLYTGVWRNHKNLTNLIKAFKILHEKHSELKLVITGRPDPHYPEVKEITKKLKLQNSVIFPGLVSEKELLHLYNDATIFTFPSLYEGFGMPPLEAMACGTPVACSNSSSLPEICGKENAIFFDPTNPNDIAEKIEFLYNDKELQQKLIANGKAHIRQFSWEKMSQQIFEILQTCLNPSKIS